jgi:predicted unusual protein kinase regulating ubiquinone biosynthesis (AarF/ABC1/UbiB family)
MPSMSDDHRKLPKGRLGRLARLASVGARSGARLLLNRDSGVAAKKAADVLGNMRGLATKVGQMASYVDGVLPEQHRDAYETWMTKLQSKAPKSSPEAIRAAVQAEFGASVDALFAEWSDTPFASASIGQVHRAVLEDGRVVAVKVQHPGIREAMDADLKNAGFLESTVGAMAGLRRFDSKRIMEEIRGRFREELDYRMEAERQRAFAELFVDDPTVVIPAVIADRSGDTVLCTELVEGLSLEEAQAASEDDRRAWCETLWRFVYKSSLCGGLFNADPHPGNFFFQPNGAVACIDFGCVQPVNPEKSKYALALHRAAHIRDDAAFAEATRNMLDLKGGAYEPRAIEYVRLCFEPLWHTPFRMTRPYVAELVEKMKVLALDFRKGKNDGYVPLPPNMFFLNRLQFGFYSVLARLDAPVDYRAVELGFLGEATGG